MFPPDSNTLSLEFQKCFSILNGGFASAAVMISVGGVLGKLNPFQILAMSLIEAAMFVLSCFIGYEKLQVIDVGT